MSKKSDEYVMSLYKEHLNGKSQTVIAKENNTSYYCIHALFKSRGLKTKKGLHSKVLYKKEWDENYFKDINSHDKSYWLGLLFADGYIWNRNGKPSIGLKLKSSDKQTILDFQKCLKSFHYKIGKGINNKTGTFGLELRSDKMSEDLINLGIKYNKSQNEMNIPIINKEFINSFILGFLDGDGWISVGKKDQIGICCSSEIFLNEIKEILNLNEIKCNIYCRDNSKINPNYKKLYTLLIADSKSRVNFLDYIYKDSVFFIERKRKKCLIMIDNALNKKT